MVDFPDIVIGIGHVRMNLNQDLFIQISNRSKFRYMRHFQRCVKYVARSFRIGHGAEVLILKCCVSKQLMSTLYNIN